MAQQVRSTLGTGANLQRNIELGKEAISIIKAGYEALEGINKSERSKKLENAQNYIGSLLITHYQNYKSIIDIYLEIQNNGGFIKLSNGRTLTENSFIIGLSAYCGLSDLVVRNGGDQDAILDQCDYRMGVLEMSLRNCVIAKDDFLLMLDAFQMDIVSDTIWRGRKWAEEQNKKLEAALQPVITKLQQAHTDAKDKAEKMKKKANKKIWGIF